MSKTVRVATNFEPSILEEVTIEWKLEGYSWIKDKLPGEAIKSPVLYQGAGVEVTLLFYPGGNEQGQEDFTSAYVVFRSLDSNSLRISFTVSLKNNVESITYINANEKLLLKDSKLCVNDIQKLNRRWGKAKCIKKADIPKHLIDNCLSFQIALKVWSDSSIDATTSPSTSLLLSHGADVNDFSELSKNLGQLLCSGVHTDVTFRICGEQLAAHKLILSSRSKVFEQMFYGPEMRESLAGAEVQIEDIELGTMKAFIHALYTANIEATFWQDSELLCHLLKAFHKYEVRQLMSKCECQVSALLSVENVCERFMLAELLDLPNLRSSALAFITNSSKSLADVQITEGFKRLTIQRPALVVEILAKVAPPSEPSKRSRQSSDEALPENLHELTVLQLKQLLGDRGLPSTGNKAALVERLRASKP